MSYPEILIAALVVAGFIVGIRLMQVPAKAIWGNRLGALCMLLAILLTLYYTGAITDFSVWILIIIGALIGIVLGQKVTMIQMPQMVALFNGLGGGASALVAGAVLAFEGADGGYLLRFTALLTLALGMLTFSGSVVAALKLHNLISQKPVMLQSHKIIQSILFTAGLILIIAGTFGGEGASMLIYIIFPALGFSVFGILMAIRVGGADMPIIISFFNSMSGIATAVCALVVVNPYMAGVGSLVGVAGLILTRIMCTAMNRNLLSVLSGIKPDTSKDPVSSFFKEELKEEFKEEAPSFKEEMQNAVDRLSDEEEQALQPVSKQDPTAAGSGESPKPGTKELTVQQRIETACKDIKKAIIVPGYGMAVAQAQQQVFELIKTLEDKGIEVKIAIHPVAGRMPGHMSVLLAEAGVDYDKLLDMDTVNPEFKEADLVIAVGACDVINPAANTAEGSPIYGMPVLAAEEAATVIVCNMDEKPGYSGVDNTLYGQEKTVCVWGNAAETVPELTGYIKEA